MMKIECKESADNNTGQRDQLLCLVECVYKVIVSPSPGDTLCR